MPTIFIVACFISFFSWALNTKAMAFEQSTAPTIPSENIQLLTAINTINHHLERMVLANFTELPNRPVLNPDFDSMALRHIVLKLQKPYLQLQTLRQLHGLMEQPSPILNRSSFDIANVNQFIEAFQTDVNELAQVMMIDVQQSPSIKIVDQQNIPAKIYQQLSYTTALIYALGAPPIIPNDVYRVADTIVQSLERIRMMRNIANTPKVVKERAFRPPQVYTKGRELAIYLKSIANTNNDYQIQGGYWVGEELGSEVHPTDVIDLLFSILADLAQLQWQLGVADAIKIQPAKAGMMPIDVYQRISYALALAQTLK